MFFFLYLGKPFVAKKAPEIPLHEQVILEPELEEALKNATDAEMCDIAGKIYYCYCLLLLLIVLIAMAALYLCSIYTIYIGFLQVQLSKQCTFMTGFIRLQIIPNSIFSLYFRS